MNIKREFLFSAPEDDPGVWLIFAIEFKELADRIDWMKNKEDSYFIKQYLLLMGLSFENMLKGLIVLSNINKNVKPIPKWMENTHDLKKIAEELVKLGDTNLSGDDFPILEELTLYIKWLGRYPTQKTKDAVYIKEMSDFPNAKHVGDSSTNYTTRLIFWNKLYKYFKKEGYIIKGIGNERFRLYFDKSKNNESPMNLKSN